MLRPRINPVQPRASAARVPRPSSAWAGIYLGGNQWTSARPARAHTPPICHLERSEAPAKRSRKTPLLPGSHEKQNTSPPRTAEARVAERVPRPSSAWAGIYLGGNQWTSASPARPHTPHVCHLERCEAPAERSRKTPLLPRSHETDIHFHRRPPRRELP
jgi:hypothetical protein